MRLGDFYPSDLDISGVGLGPVGMNVRWVGPDHIQCQKRKKKDNSYFCIYFTNNLFTNFFTRLHLFLCTLKLPYKKLTMDFKITTYKSRLSLTHCLYKRLSLPLSLVCASEATQLWLLLLLCFSLSLLSSLALSWHLPPKITYLPPLPSL